jgi:hypothetical protein
MAMEFCQNERIEKTAFEKPTTTQLEAELTTMITRLRERENEYVETGCKYAPITWLRLGSLDEALKKCNDCNDKYDNIKSDLESQDRLVQSLCEALRVCLHSVATVIYRVRIGSRNGFISETTSKSKRIYCF